MQRKRYPVPVWLQWIMGVALAVAVVGVPFLYYRWTYVQLRRLRVVEPGKLYRCGRMTGVGFAETLKTYKIRTVINLMDEEPDPDLLGSYFGRGSVKERELCARHGAEFVFFMAGTVHPRDADGEKARPAAIDRFLAIMDDPAKHPVLIHCRAGLHRTGLLSAVYRMEYDGWTPAQAWHELREMGFGEGNCFADNQYVRQYLFQYRPGLRGGQALAAGGAAGADATSPVSLESAP